MWFYDLHKVGRTVFWHFERSRRNRCNPNILCKYTKYVLIWLLFWFRCDLHVLWNSWAINEGMVELTDDVCRPTAGQGADNDDVWRVSLSVWFVAVWLWLLILWNVNGVTEKVPSSIDQVLLNILWGPRYCYVLYLCAVNRSVMTFHFCDTGL